MDTQAIVDRARRNCHTDSTNYTDAQALEDLNLVYQELVDEIVVNTKGDFFWDKWVTNTVLNQSEYIVEKLWIDPDDLDIKKINKVFIKYSDTDTQFTTVTYQNPGVLIEHPDYYKTNQPKSNPFFYIQDTSIFVYPAPDESITDWLEIFVIHKPADLTLATTEDNIEIPTQFHKLISEWLRPYIFEAARKTNEAMIAQQSYEKGILKMADFMKQRYNQPLKKTFSNVNQFR